MKIPANYFSDVMSGDVSSNSIYALHTWVCKNKPSEIIMTEKQFWEFTKLQPLPYEERYWNTFHGIPLRCPEMTNEQQVNLRLIK